MAGTSELFRDVARGMRAFVQVVIVGVVGLALLSTAGCGSSGSDVSSGGGTSTTAPTTTANGATDLIELTEGDACGDAWFWAATPDGDLAVTVSVEARNRSTTEATTIPIDLPDEAVTVQVLRGDGLPRNFCTDVLDTESQPTAEQGATAGTGEIVLEPAPTAGNDGCGTSNADHTGTLHLEGLKADDGTQFAPIDIQTHGIGCYSG